MKAVVVSFKDLNKGLVVPVSSDTTLKCPAKVVMKMIYKKRKKKMNVGGPQTPDI